MLEMNRKKNNLISNEKRHNPNKKVIEDGYSVKDAAFLVEVNYQAAANVIKIEKSKLKQNILNYLLELWATIVESHLNDWKDISKAIIYYTVTISYFFQGS